MCVSVLVFTTFNPFPNESILPPVNDFFLSSSSSLSSHPPTTGRKVLRSRFSKSRDPYNEFCEYDASPVDPLFTLENLDLSHPAPCGYNKCFFRLKHSSTIGFLILQATTKEDLLCQYANARYLEAMHNVSHLLLAPPQKVEIPFAAQLATQAYMVVKNDGNHTIQFGNHTFIQKVTIAPKGSVLLGCYQAKVDAFLDVWNNTLRFQSSASLFRDQLQATLTRYLDIFEQEPWLDGDFQLLVDQKGNGYLLDTISKTKPGECRPSFDAIIQGMYTAPPLEEEASQFEMTFFPIISMQRSGSTSTANTLLKETHCPYKHLVPLGEIFDEHVFQSGDAWEVDAQQYLFQNKARRKKQTLSGEDWVRFIVRVAQRRCQWLALTATPFLRNSSGQQKTSACAQLSYGHKHCIVTLKHFSIHPTSFQASRQLWRLLPQPKVVVVLERPVEDRWKSWVLANTTGDWDVWGTAKHKEAIAKQPTPPIAPWFRQEHLKWYELVRNESLSERPFGGAPVVYLDYAETVITNPEECRKRLLQLANISDTEELG